MTLTHRLGVAAFAVLLLGGAAVSGQNRVPGPDLVGIAEMQARHAELKRAIETNTLTHILTSRVAVQNQQLVGLTQDGIRIQSQLTEAVKARAAADAEVKRLTERLAADVTPNERNAATALLTASRTNQERALQSEQNLASQLQSLTASQTAARKKFDDLNTRLDQIERSLIQSR